MIRFVEAYELTPALEIEDEFLETIAELAATGRTGEQIAELLGLVPELGFETLAELDAYFPLEVLAEATGDQVAFETAYRQVMRRVVTNERQMLADLKSSIEEYRRDVLDLVQEPSSEWATTRLDRVKRGLTDATNRLEHRLTGGFNRFANENASLALLSVDNPLAKMGLRVDTIPVTIPTDHLAVMFNNVPTLIRGVTEETARKVGQTLTAQTLGGLNAVQARRKIAGMVGALPRQAGRLNVPGNIFDAAENRARTIMRTEANRVFSTVATARIDDLAERIPGVGKVWMHSPGSSHDPRPDHAALNGKVIFPAKGEKFNVGGTLAEGPYDPALPAEQTVNCHCRVRVAYDAEVQAASGKEAPSLAEARRAADDDEPGDTGERWPP